jgi:hypothetical protein
MNELECLRCTVKLVRSRRVRVLIGANKWSVGWLLGGASREWSVEVFRCPSCGHLEMFDPAFGHWDRAEPRQ